MVARRASRALLAASVVLAMPGADAAGVGTPAPACALAPLGASPGVETGRLRGRVVYLDFWASWCGPCAQAFPFLNALQRDLGGRGLAVVGVNVDEVPADGLRFLQKVPAAFIVGGDAAGTCPRAFGVEAMPTSYLIDRHGTIRYVHAGFRAGDAPDLRRRVEDLLRENASIGAPGTASR